MAGEVAVSLTIVKKKLSFAAIVMACFNQGGVVLTEHGLRIAYAPLDSHFVFDVADVVSSVWGAVSVGEGSSERRRSRSKNYP